MAGASDKARFYLEKYVPELQEYERKEIFTRDEISAIAARRSDFEHIINARGSKPSDYARYATYEMNVDSLRKKRCKRLGVKGTKGHIGQRTIFFILERATKKFPGDMGLWMQYIQFCQHEKANKKLGKVFTSVLRLKPRDWGLWILAAKWYAEQQGDMTTARSYMQRGLRFCKDDRKLWIEYAKLEMVYLAKLAARRKILGLDEERKNSESMEDDEDMIVLPTITAADVDPDAAKGTEEIDAKALERLAQAPAYTGAIPLAIFDAAMKQFNDDPELAEVFFECVASFDQVPATPQLLQHIVSHLQSKTPNAPEKLLCDARLRVNAYPVGSIEFPAELGSYLSTIKSGFAGAPDKNKAIIAEKATLVLVEYLDGVAEADDDIATVIVASIHRYLRILAVAPSQVKSSQVRAMLETLQTSETLTAEDMLHVSREAIGKGQR